ncbi:hypothetical protein SynRS9902_01902 [Synechococcus sp. RS9902]|nr:hypothetical protein SynRS9902_01902 [Synechococcus sp. RS9902]
MYFLNELCKPSAVRSLNRLIASSSYLIPFKQGNSDDTVRWLGVIPP